MTSRTELDRSSRTLFGQIADIWRDRILSGEFKPGDLLPSEREVAAELDVSRIPVREAMKSLEYLGVVRQVRGKGVVVQEANLENVLMVVGPLMTKFSPKILVDLFDYRLQIEPYAAEQAALRATEEDIRRMREAIEKHRQAWENSENSEETSFEFHTCVLMAAHNEILSIVTKFLSEVQHYSRHMTLWNEERRRSAYEDHKAIFEAIVAKNPKLARVRMESHLLNAQSVLPHGEEKKTSHSSLEK